MSTRIVGVVLFVLLQVVAFNSALAQSLFTMPPSPEATGRGGLYMSGESNDPLAPLTNPALLGLSADHNQFMAGFYPSRTSWGSNPESFYNWNFAYSSRAMSVGLDRRTLGRLFDIKTPFSFGIGYLEAREESGDIPMYDENHDFLGMFHTRDVVRGWSVGVGYHSRIVDLGLGWNNKFISLDPGYREDKVNPTASDIGFVAQSRIEKSLNGQNDERSWRITAIPSLSYAVTNVGAEYRYPQSSRGEALPRNATVGLALSTGLRSNSIARGKINVLGVSVGEQIGSYLARVRHDGSHYYVNALGSLQPVNDLVLGKPHESVSRQQGIEVSILETAFARWGEIKQANDNYFSYGASSYTSGYGIRLAGVLMMITENQFAPSGIPGVLMRHLDVQYQYAEQHFQGTYYSYMNPMSFHELALLWRN